MEIVVESTFTIDKKSGNKLMLIPTTGLYVNT